MEIIVEILCLTFIIGCIVYMTKTDNDHWCNIKNSLKRKEEDS